RGALVIAYRAGTAVTLTGEGLLLHARDALDRRFSKGPPVLAGQRWTPHADRCSSADPRRGCLSVAGGCGPHLKTARRSRAGAPRPGQRKWSRCPPSPHRSTATGAARLCGACPCWARPGGDGRTPIALVAGGAGSGPH